MRVEHVAMRTWWLAALAGVAVLFLLAALAGLGSRIEPLPADPALVRPLPQVVSASTERLGPLAQYAEIGRRPLFSQDRQPQPFSLQADGKVQTSANQFSYVLTGVLLTPMLKMAIVEPTGGGDAVRVKLGQALESMPSWRLLELQPRSAVFVGPEGRRSLELRHAADGDGQKVAPAVAGQAVPGEKKPEPASATNATQADQDPAQATVTTPEARMQAIKKRILERREQQRRESGQTQPEGKLR